MKTSAVTGMGVSGAGYQDLSTFEDLLRLGRTSIQRHQLFQECDFPAAQIGAVLSKEEVFADGANLKIQKATRRYSLVYQTAASAMLQAWQQAGLTQQPYKPEEIAIIVAGQNLHLKEQYQAFQTFIKEPSYVKPGYSQHFIDTTLMSFLSELFHIQGGGFHVSAATASGNLGIIQAIKILDNRIKCCILIGAMADLSPVELQGFYNCGALGGDGYQDIPEKACRPFDTGHNGFIYGQGCACLVIESPHLAQARGQPVLAHIIGAASCLDANRSTQPSLEGEVHVMRQVLEEARHPQVDYINTHGTSTPLGDEIEAKAIEQVFQDKPYINATKALIGHTLWSAAVIECIACVIQLQKGFLHANINLDNPINPGLNFVGKQSMNQAIQTALSLSFGFGGINSAVLINK